MPLARGGGTEWPRDRDSADTRVSEEDASCVTAYDLHSFPIGILRRWLCTTLFEGSTAHMQDDDTASRQQRFRGGLGNSLLCVLAAYLIALVDHI